MQCFQEEQTIYIYISQDCQETRYELESMGTHLIQLIAEVDGIDVVAFQIREHDNLNNCQP